MELTYHEHLSEPRAALLRLFPAGRRPFVHHPRRPVLQHHRHRAGPGPGWQPSSGHRGPAHADRGAGPLGLVRLPAFPARGAAALAVALAHPATLGLLGFQVFFFWGVQQAGVAVGTVTAIGFSPVMAAILARIILGERPARIWYPATGLALAGLVLLNLGSSQDTSTAALLLPLLAGACYGAYFVFSKPLGRTHAPEHIMLLLCAGSGLLLLPVHFCTPPLWLLHPQGMGMALYLGVVTAALAFSLTLAGLRRTPTAMAATLALVEPLGAACWGIFLLHEPVGGQELAGMGLLFGGVALLALGKKTENTPPTEEHASSRPLSGEGAPQH